MELYKVKTKTELRMIILGNTIPLDTLDVSNITDMNQAFSNIHKITGSIANWDVSHVINMSNMFTNSTINTDISKWDVSKVENMNFMFAHSRFSHNLGAWDFQNKSIDNIFKNCYYSMEDYQKDREEYLSVLKLEKEKIDKENNEKYLAETKAAINKELSKDVEVYTIELEF